MKRKEGQGEDGQCCEMAEQEPRGKATDILRRRPRDLRATASWGSREQLRMNMIVTSSATEAPSQGVKAPCFRRQIRRQRKIRKQGIGSSKVKERADHCKSSGVTHKFENRRERTNLGAQNARAKG